MTNSPDNFNEVFGGDLLPKLSSRLLDNMLEQLLPRDVLLDQVYVPSIVVGLIVLHNVGVV
jgi:hypothetical protein